MQMYIISYPRIVRFADDASGSTVVPECAEILCTESECAAFASTEDIPRGPWRPCKLTIDVE